MKKLQTADVFKAMRLVQRSGARERLISVIKRIASEGMTQEEAGIAGILAVVEAVSDEGCEKAIYEFFSGPFECAPEDVARMELSELCTKLEQLKEENDLGNFFRVLSQLISKKR